MVPQLLKEICRKQKELHDLFEAFMEFLKQLSILDYHIFQANILNEQKFIMHANQLLLSSDNLRKGKAAILRIIRSLFAFINFLISDESSQNSENHVVALLETIYEQPGLIANIIFNLNHPRKDDPVILGYQIILIGTMC